MSWDALGAISEIAGAVGTIATLAYLAQQVRQSTISTRTSSYQAAVTGVSDLTRELGLSDFAHVFLRGQQEPASLTAEERARFAFLCTSLFRHFENIFYQHEQGAIDDSVWEGWENRILGTAATPGCRAWLAMHARSFSPSFRAFLEKDPPSTFVPVNALRF